MRKINNLFDKLFEKLKITRTLRILFFTEMN